jgi:hypothetical protein
MPYSLPVRCTGIVVDRNEPIIEIDDESVGADQGFQVAPAAAHNGLDACDKSTAIAWFGQEVVGTELEALNLGVEFWTIGEDQDRRAHARRAQLPQHLVAADIAQRQTEKDNVVIVELADLQAVRADRIASEILFGQHPLDADGSCRVY